MAYELRPTIMRTNARYRGQTESLKYSNLVNEVAHDINLLYGIIVGDDFVFTEKKGQIDYTYENLVAYFSGGVEPYSTIGSATVLSSLDGPMKDIGGEDDIDLNLTHWTRLFLASGDITPITGGYRLQLTGAGGNAVTGVSRIVDVLEGQLIYITMKAKSVGGTEATRYVAIGSQDVNNGLGSIKVCPITTDGTTITHVVECQHKEGISLDILTSYSGQSNADKSVEITNLSIMLLDRSRLSLAPVNTVVKSQVNVLEERIKNIIQNL